MAEDMIVVTAVAEDMEAVTAVAEDMEVVTAGAVVVDLVNNYSVLFDGSNDHMTTSADSTLATKTYSFWAKTEKTSANEVFGHGGTAIGSFQLNAGRPLLYLNDSSGDGYYYRYWVTTPGNAEEDGNWHHWVVYVEHDDITASKLYCDGVLQAVYTTATTGSAAAYTTGLRIGRSGADYFEGSLDEFAVFDGELLVATVIAIYNAGLPAILTQYGPEHWWRMGDNNNGAGTTITDQGSIPNDGTLVNDPVIGIDVPLPS